MSYAPIVRKGGIRTRVPCTCCGAPSALAVELPSDKMPLVPSPPAVRMPTYDDVRHPPSPVGRRVRSPSGFKTRVRATTRCWACSPRVPCSPNLRNPATGLLPWEPAGVTSDSSMALPFDGPARFPEATASSLTDGWAKGHVRSRPAIRQRAFASPQSLLMVRGAGIEPAAKEL